jgi:hypothetical protein
VYTVVLSDRMRGAVEPILMMLEPECRCFIAALVTSKGPRTLMLKLL